MTVSEARAELARVLDRVSAGDEVVITRHGRAVAILVRPDILRVRRADRALITAGRLREAIERGGREPLPETPGLVQERAEALISDVRAARSRR